MDQGTDKDARALAASLVEHAKRDGVTIAVAESCTGGLVGAAITSVPGASEVFWGGVIAYDNAVKQGLLCVHPKTLEDDGAVSAACAAAMARGVLSTHDTDLAVSITGVAGPEGGTPDKPVGTVWFGLARRDDRSSECVQCAFPQEWSREQIRDASAAAALRVLLSAWDNAPLEHETRRIRVD